MIYAVSYGGRRDMVEAAKNICVKVMDGVIKPEDIDEALVEKHLSNGICQVPHPDLMIRNGGKRRLSNFYLWQASHAQLYFSNSLSYDFEEVEFLDALRWFQQCQRRFGK
uniref:Rubber cis-polyprenylcistransferase n=1 Tax=Opuntia streptacantha TaxID=393608 RepID=A0A7C8ZX35_OPUST